MSNTYKLTEEELAKLSYLPYETKEGHTQHGETGIIELLTSNIKTPNKIFLEIGFGDGGENMTRDLMNNGWGGVGIDVHNELLALEYPKNFKYKQMFVTPSTYETAFSDIPNNFDFFSLDIDSFDFEVCKWALENNFKPKVVCLEFNPRFGPYVQASFPYRERIKKKLFNKHGIYGASIAKFNALWTHYGYNYFTYDSSLTNIFFYDPIELNDISSYETHSITDLPIQHDRNKQLIIQHGQWNDYLDTIYTNFGD